MSRSLPWFEIGVREFDDSENYHFSFLVCVIIVVLLFNFCLG